MSSRDVRIVCPRPYTLMGTSRKLTGNVRFNRFVSPLSEFMTHARTPVYTHTHARKKSVAVTILSLRMGGYEKTNCT